MNLFVASSYIIDWQGCPNDCKLFCDDTCDCPKCPDCTPGFLWRMWSVCVLNTLVLLTISIRRSVVLIFVEWEWFQYFLTCSFVWKIKFSSFVKYWESRNKNSCSSFLSSQFETLMCNYNMNVKFEPSKSQASMNNLRMTSIFQPLIKIKALILNSFCKFTISFHFSPSLSLSLSRSFSCFINKFSFSCSCKI